MPGRRNFMHSQCVASPIAPTIRKHSCSSTFLTARASIIGLMPSTQVMLFSLKMLIMLMSMKSTPSFCPASVAGPLMPLHFFRSALGKFVPVWGGGRPRRTLDPGEGVPNVLLGKPGRMPLDLEAEIALLEQHRRAVATKQCIAQPRLEPGPARRPRAGEITHVLVIHAEHGAKPVLLHHLPRPLGPVLAHAVPVDPLLPVQAGDAEIRTHQRSPLVQRTRAA